MSPYFKDKIFGELLRVITFFVGIIILFIAFFVLLESKLALSEVSLFSFFSMDSSWYPPNGQYSILPVLAGTLLSASLSLIIIIPVGLGVIFCIHFFYARTFGRVLRAFVEILAGMPSVVFGFWGLTVIVPFIAALSPPGPSLLAGSIVLALMALPTFVIFVDRAYRLIPTEVSRSMASLGLPPVRSFRLVVIPLLKTDMYGAAILAFCRAIGETMAILMVCGNVLKFPHSIFDPIRTLTSHMALEMAYAMGVHRSALFVSGFVLLVMSILLMVLFYWVRPEKTTYA